MKRMSPLSFGAALLLAACCLALAMTDADSDPPEPSRQDAEEAPDRLQFDDWPPGRLATRGRTLYERWCVGCHGLEGRGDGDATAFLNPLPRDFQQGKFKFRTTRSGQLPTTDDIVKTITCGLPGSSMPGFPLLPDPDRRALAAWVLYVATFGQIAREVAIVMEDEELSLAEVKAQQLDAIAAQVKTNALDGRRIVPVPASVALTKESRAAVQARYEKECAKCHGLTGRGEGNSSFTLRDWKDSELVPRDFTTGVFRSGSTPRDLYVRMRTGLTGTPMPSFEGNDAEIWGLVHYIMELVDPKLKTAQKHAGCAMQEEGR